MLGNIPSFKPITKTAFTLWLLDLSTSPTTTWSCVPGILPRPVLPSPIFNISAYLSKLTFLSPRTKTISSNEYQLLKEFFIEKQIYDYQAPYQAIYEYLLENKAYPFHHTRMRMVIFSLNRADVDIVKKMLNEVYAKCYVVEIYNLYICFYEENPTQIQDLFVSLSIDLGYDIILHEGFIVNEAYLGRQVLEYIKIYHDYININKKSYTDLADMILNLGSMGDTSLKLTLKKNVILPLLEDVTLKDIISVMLKNDLNVSKTAKLLYMNRNSLINRLDYIYKETNLNLQKFTHACAIYVLVNFF